MCTQRGLQRVYDVIVFRIDRVTMLISDGNGQHRRIAIIEQQLQQRGIDAARLTGEITLDDVLVVLAHANAFIALALYDTPIQARQPDGIDAIALA